MELVIDRPVAGGRMLARHEGRVVLVAGAVPGERVRARVERVTRQAAFASVVEVLDASEDRRVPACDPACGGAAYAHIRYDRQRALKAEVVADAFRRIGRIALESAVTVAASSEQGYRLRARLHVRDGRAGFFLEGTHVLCDAGASGQLRPETMAAIEATLAALSARLADCDAFVVAENVAGTECVIHVETRDGARLDDLSRRLEAPAGVSGLTTGVRGRTVVLAGTGTVTDTADQLFEGRSPVSALTCWTRHAASFFQGNRYLTGALLRRVLECATGDCFVDLYAGVGLFAVALAARGSRGLAVEGDRSSGADLEVNAGPWRERLRVVRGPVEAAVDLPLDPAPDLVVVDPPRTGLSPDALRGVLAWSAPRVVYVSCDPPTLARDAARFIQAGYALQSVEAFDLFPNTPHVEVVATFTR
jgi:23S rRNA (uracil1939-C5)-methyltransferase